MQYWQFFIFIWATIVVRPHEGRSECFPVGNCVCTAEYQGDVKYSCQVGESMVDVSRKGETITITCPSKSISLTNQWPELIKGVNVSGNCELVNIQACPVPEKSIKIILSELSIWKMKILRMNLMKRPLSSLQESHFENLDSVQTLELTESNLMSLPETVFSGLPNVETLILRNINLLSLSPNLFKPVPKVKFLDLGFNHLASLQLETFKYLPNLKLLNLNSNKLSNLTKDLFLHLPRLTKLDLNSNEITTLPEDIFQYLPSLTHLNLNFNNISTLPETIFNNTKSLRDIRAMQSHNRKLSSIPSGLFSNLVQLENITMEANNLTDLPEDMFTMTTNLRLVSLNRNSLKQLPGTLFKDSTKIRRMEIHHNKLAFLNDTLFHGLRELQVLYLQNNQLTSINQTVFKDLSSLQELYLENNKLAYLHHDVFKGLSALRIINLNNNRLDMKKDFTYYSLLSGCVHIEDIHLRNNTVEDIMEDWVLTDLKLRTLDLSYNRLENLKVQNLQFLAANDHVVKLDLRHNRIETIDLYGLENRVKFMCQSPPCKTISRNLEILLNGNQMNCDCRLYDFVRYVQRDMTPAALKYAAIEDSEQLKCATPNHLNNTLLSRIQPRELYCPWNGSELGKNVTCPTGCSCFILPSKINTLVINCNNVTNLPSKLIDADVGDLELLLPNNGLQNLQFSSSLMSPKVVKLSLAFNALTNIHDLVLPDKLRTLELDHNQFSYLDKKDIEKLNETDLKTSISLHNNPWKCDCNTKYLLNFMQARFSQIPFVTNITCVDSGKAIIEYSVDDLCKISLTLIITCISVAVFGLLFGTATLFYLQYHHEIKVWMFAHKICLWLITEKEVDRNKEYDAFVSYSHLDEDFIVKHLKPQLEDGLYSYKLCLHYRDWVVGDYIPEQIVRSVGNSRRTIVVLSPNFLNSIWGKLEFRTAHLEAIKERHARVIIILLNDLSPNDQVDPELKAYLTMNTYLKWGDPWFWDKLRYAMPHHWHRKETISLSKEVQNMKDTFRSSKLNMPSCLDLKVQKMKNKKASNKRTLLCFT